MEAAKDKVQKEKRGTESESTDKIQASRGKRQRNRSASKRKKKQPAKKIWGGSSDYTIVIDFEMYEVKKKIVTGEKKEGDLIYLCEDPVQIGAVLLDADGKIISAFSSYMRPTYGTPTKYVQDLTGITEETLKDAPSFEEVMEALCDWLPDKPFEVFSWGPDDRMCLRNAYRARHIEKQQKIDKMFGHWNDLQKIYQQEKRPENKNQIALRNALRECGIKQCKRRHDALNDAWDESKVYRFLKREEQ